MSKGDDTRQAILDHATRLASRVGLEGLTIGDLARDLHLSKSGLFAHFQSKEALQVQVIEAAARRFVDQVIRPALAAARGEPRLRALFDRWLAWGKSEDMPGGCLFIAAAIELDDKPGIVRDHLVQRQRDWLDALALAARIAVAEGHFRGDVDPDQFAFEAYGVMLVYHHMSRLFADPRAEDRARRAFEAILAADRL